MLEFLSTPWYALQMVIAFGAVIFIHELGHFLAAKRNGVRVLKFAIGFDFGGLKLWSRTVSGTEYVVGAFPLGGYVRMLGQEDLPAEGEDQAGEVPPDSFQAKTVWQRMQIISAGVVANFLSAFLFCFLAFTSGFDTTATEVGAVGFDSLRAGLRTGDRITALDGTPVSSWQDLMIHYGTAEPGSQVAAEVDRGGQRLLLDLPVQRDPSSPFNQPDFTPASSLQISEVVTETTEGPTAAARAGIQPGDVIREVDGRPVDSWQQFSRVARSRAGAPTRLAIDRPLDRRSQSFERVELVLTPGSQPDEYTGPWSLGVESGEPPRIDVVLPGFPAAEAGLKAGDEVVAVGGEPVATWRELWLRTAYAPADVPVALDVRAADGAGTRRVEVVPGPPDHWNGLGVWGVVGLGMAHRVPDGLVVGRVQPGSPAERAGIRAGDRILEVGPSAAPANEGAPRLQPVRTWNQLYAALARMGGPEAEVAWEREGQRAAQAVTLAPAPEARMRGFVGVGTGEKRAWVEMGPLEAVVPALRQPFQILRQQYRALVALVLGRLGTEALAGPLGIGRAIWYAAEQSVGEVFNLVAAISINLAIINFLPIPITDGGHFLFLAYERLKGRRVNDEVQARLQWAGLIFLLLVFVFATWNDLSNLLLR